MSKREEDFFSEATKQIRDSYVFQNDESYSDDDVRDIAASLAEYGYQYALQHPQWIPVEKELPEKDNEFEDYSKLVIVTNGKDFWKGMYNYGGEEWLTFDLWKIDDATHWMEIVPPRKEE